MKKLLKLKTLTPLDKLFILEVMNYEKMKLPCNLTSQDFATALGTTRKNILNAIEKLIEMDYIKCKVVAPHRTTTITERLYNIIN